MNPNQRPAVIGIGGLTSEVGKTTLLCQLLATFTGWEAIKTTRGHYRSCGKDPHTCCVSDLLSEEPVVHSGRETTYVAGKDTGRYWDAGAIDVHWVIATDEQVEGGINEALSRVRAEGVLVEGNSFTEFVKPDFFVLVADSATLKIKPTARRALSRVDAVYVSQRTTERDKETIRKFLRNIDPRDEVKFFGDDQFAELVVFIRAQLSASVSSGDNLSATQNILNLRDNKGLTQASRS